MVSRRERRRGEEVIVIFLPTEWVSELLTLPEHSSLAAPLSPVLRVLAYSSRATWDCLQLAGWHYGLSDAWDLISVPTGSTSSFMTAQAALYSKKRQSILVFELLHASKPRPFFFFFFNQKLQRLLKTNCRGLSGTAGGRTVALWSYTFCVVYNKGHQVIH